MLLRLKTVYLLPFLILSSASTLAFNCPNQIEGKTILSSNIIGTGKFEPISTGNITTFFGANHNMSAKVDGKTVSAHYDYHKLTATTADINVSHPQGPYKGLSYVSHLNCQIGTFFAQASDGASWMAGNFIFKK